MTLSAEPPFDFRASSLEANLHALSLSLATRDSVRAAAARGDVVHMPDGAPALVVDGATLGAHGDLASRERTLAQVTANPDGVVVIFGLGLGHTVRELRARSDARMLVYEPDPAVLRRVLEWGPCDLAGVPIVSDLLELGIIWGTMTRGRAKAVLVRTPGYEQAYPDAARELEAELRRLVTDIQINENTYYFRSRIWLHDILQNLPRAVGTTPFMALEGRYAGVPAFIVGAGPSLDKNGLLLRLAAQKGIVIAVNTAAPALARLGVVPQVLACLESIDLSQGLAQLPFIDQVVRAFSLSGHPAHLGVGSGPLLPIFENITSFDPLIRLFGVKGLPVGASVTTAGFSLAERLGCNPIVLVGQDLAFTESQVYARGTAYEGSTVHIARGDGRIEHQWSPAAVSAHGTTQGALPRAEKLLEVVGWGGQSTVSTSPSFAAVRTWLETAATVVLRARPELSLVNATEGGARIKSFEERRLADLLATMPDRGISSGDIAHAAELTVRTLTAEKLTSWTAVQRELTARVERSAKAVGDIAEQAQGELSSAESSSIAGTWKSLERAEQALRESSANQPFVEAEACSHLQAIQARSDDARLENSSQAAAAFALRQEAEIAAVIVRAAEEVERLLAALAAQPNLITQPRT